MLWFNDLLGHMRYAQKQAMKLIISGGRDYTPDDQASLRLRTLVARLEVSEIVSGGATGVDRWAEEWAESHGVPVKRFKVTPDQWRTLGKKAGPLRNREMARYGDALLVFPGGKGTRSMVAEAKKAVIMIIDWR